MGLATGASPSFFRSVFYLHSCKNGNTHPRMFRQCMERYRGHYRLQPFSCWNPFLCMAFAQPTFRESLRDTEGCLAALPFTHRS